MHNLLMKMFLLAQIIACAFSIHCSSDTSVSPDSGNDLTQDDLTDISGPYLGQTPPGTSPVRFAVGEFLAQDSWFWHGPLSISPSGDELFFSKIFDGSSIQLQYSKIVNNFWTKPQRPTFAQDGESNGPVFSQDGNELYFFKDGSIYLTSRNQSDWSTPQRINVPTSLSLGWQFSVAGNKNIYLELWSNNKADIYKAKFEKGQYSSPELLGSEINTDYNNFTPFIHPEEQYIIFSSNRPGGFGGHDLYISFVQTDGSWTNAENMGSTINSAAEEANPCVSLDGEYLFFTTERAGDQGYNPYWVSAQIIENYRQ